MTIGEQIKSKGVTVLFIVGGALLLGYIVKKKAGAVVDSVKQTVTEDLNPASDKNIVYKNTPDVVKSNFDKFFATIDLINPFNESDVYARQVLGIETAYEKGKKVVQETKTKLSEPVVDNPAAPSLWSIISPVTMVASSIYNYFDSKDSVFTDEEKLYAEWESYNK